MVKFLFGESRSIRVGQTGVGEPERYQISHGQLKRKNKRFKNIFYGDVYDSNCDHNTSFKRHQYTKGECEHIV